MLSRVRPRARRGSVALALICGSVFAVVLGPAGRAVGSASLTSANAGNAFLAQLPRGIHIPAKEGAPCPKVEIFNGHSECYVEYRLAGRWYLAGGNVTVSNRALAVKLFSSGHWIRRWRRCSLTGWRVPGTLRSNNGCGLHAGESDAYLVGQEMWSESAGRVTDLDPGWQFTDSAGFGSIGGFPCKVRGGTYVCINAVGDSFRFTP